MLWSFTVNPDFESALGKPNLLIDPVGFTPIGAEIEGLIHTARCLTGNSIELLAPAVGGPAWPGGLSSPFITPPYGKCLRQMRCRLTLFCPSECRAQLHCYRRRPPVSSCFWRSLKNICFLLLTVGRYLCGAISAAENGPAPKIWCTSHSSNSKAQKPATV